MDIAAIVIAFASANLIRFGSILATPGWHFASAFLPIFVVLAFSGQSYSIAALNSPVSGVFRAIRAFSVTAAVLLLVLFYLKTTAEFSRSVFGIGALSAAVMLASFRYGFGQFFGNRYRWNFVNEVLLVDGVSVYPDRGQIVMFAEQLGLDPDANDPQTFDRIGRLLVNCDRVVLACPPSNRTSWARTLKGAGIGVEVLTPELDHLGPLQLRHSGGRTAILLASGPLGLRDRLLKRTLDLGVSLPALILCIPIMLVIACAIKLGSNGPVFFRQPRVGQGNRIFEVLKFRTMRVEQADSSGTRSASRDDDRITPVGRILRRTSLDELPQLINVVIGDMSLVGPRPHALASTAEAALFWHIDERYWQRGAVKPGITGLAQVRGFRGATDRREDLTNRLQADLEYLANWSIWRDISILFRTFKVLIHPNAF
jgi:exopolysaccharide biosynthesis polyprenyl glycosylphosphotransferase